MTKNTAMALIKVVAEMPAQSLECRRGNPSHSVLAAAGQSGTMGREGAWTDIESTSLDFITSMIDRMLT